MFEYSKPSINRINWGEPFVDISEDQIYPIYPATHAKSLKHFLVFKLNMYTTDNNCIFKLTCIYVRYFYALLSNIISGT